MKKFCLMLCVILAVCSFMCACESGLQYDYSDGDATGELISMENKKVSDDEIGITVVTLEDKENLNKVKVYKSDFVYDDFSFKYEKVRFSDYAYVADEDMMPQYPEKIVLPEYDLAALRTIMLTAYAEKYGELKEDGSIFISQPKFTTKNFTGRLVVSYAVYSHPATDEFGVGCYSDAKKIVMTCDLYTYEVE